MSKSEFEEKRAAKRFKKELMVHFRVKASASLKNGQVSVKPYADISRTNNLSLQGMSFNTARKIPISTILDLNLRLPVQRQPINLQGKVVECKELGQGKGNALLCNSRVQFIQLEKKQIEALENFIRILKNKD